MIHLENISKSYKNSTNALTNISFDVEEGEIIGLIGDNGAGKSTLFKILSSIIKPSSGTCLLGGIDIVKEPTKSQKKTGLLLGGDLGLYDKLTGKENIYYYGQLHGMSNKQIDLSYEVLSKELNLDKFINKTAGVYSRGMKLRTAIARACIHDPEILFLDEPTSGLDAGSLIDVHNMILRYNYLGKTILISSHNPFEIQLLCKKIIFLEKGSINIEKSQSYVYENAETISIANRRSIEVVNSHKLNVEKVSRLPR